MEQSNSLQRVCGVCGQSHTRTLYYPKNSPGPVVRCQNCGFVYIASFHDPSALIFDESKFHIDPKLLISSDLSEFPQGYWEFSLLPAKLVELPALQRNAHDAVRRLEHHLSGGNILDIGCGWGIFIDVARHSGWKSYGLEPLPGHAAYGRAKLKLEVITGTLKDDTFPAAYFDAITAFQVFEHLPDISATIRRLWKIQKPGGLILIEVPNIKTLGVTILRGRHRHFNPDHINFFSAQTLRLFLEQNGYQVLETYYPTRYMTLYHLVNHWFRRFFPARMVDAASKMIQQRGMVEKLVRINLGDILGVIAQKRIEPINGDADHGYRG